MTVRRPNTNPSLPHTRGHIRGSVCQRHSPFSSSWDMPGMRSTSEQTAFRTWPTASSSWTGEEGTESARPGGDDCVCVSELLGEDAGNFVLKMRYTWFYPTIPTQATYKIM